MHVTSITHRVENRIYTNTVAHECTFGDFLKDMKREITEFVRGKTKETISNMDVFWHLNKYCEEVYGTCYHQEISLESITQPTRIVTVGHEILSPKEKK